MKQLDLKERIEKLLDYLNINQKEFAKKTGLSENTISHAKKGKHTPSIEFFNSIYRILPNLNAKWLYMGIGEMFADTKHSIHEAGKEFMQTMKIYKKKLKEEECNEELQKAENEIIHLKTLVEDKDQIINLLKKSKAS